MLSVKENSLKKQCQNSDKQTVSGCNSPPELSENIPGCSGTRAGTQCSTEGCSKDVQGFGTEEDKDFQGQWSMSTQ